MQPRSLRTAYKTIALWAVHFINSPNSPSSCEKESGSIHGRDLDWLKWGATTALSQPPKMIDRSFCVSWVIFRWGTQSIRSRKRFRSNGFRPWLSSSVTSLDCIRFGITALLKTPSVSTNHFIVILLSIFSGSPTSSRVNKSIVLTATNTWTNYMKAMVLISTASGRS